MIYTLRQTSLFAALAWLALTVYPAQAQIITNGRFATGDLSGFTVFTTPGGTNGNGLPVVTQFDVTGSGPANAARFNVGESSGGSSYEGGGLSQSVFFTGPTLATLSADTAVRGANAEDGLFQLLLDNTVVASYDYGNKGSFLTYRQHLSGTTTITGGTHIVSVKITRDFGSAVGDTPDQYVTNIALSVPAPEPSTWTAFTFTGLGVVGLIFRARKRRAPEPSSVASFSFTGLGVAGLMLQAKKRSATRQA